jgi:ABC-type antimicrobial peptide transport system permease subunit
MFGTYLRRELKNRRRQTSIVAIGMALAIALVILVNALAGGVKNAQASALQSVYGVGTDITVSHTTTAPSAGGQRFDFGSNAGTSNGSTKKLSTSRLSTAMGTTAFSSSVLSTVEKTSGVKSATGVLSLNNTSFSGSIPSGSGSSSSSGSSATRPSMGTSGGAAGGPSSFGVNQTTVLGYDTATSTGPISSTTLTSGRLLKASDAGTFHVVLDTNYATSASKKVGSTVSLGGTTFTVVGIVSSTSTDSASAANVYMSLPTAQKVSGETGKLTSVDVTASSSNDVTAAKTALTSALGSKYTVNTESDLASTVSGSLSTASTLASTLGTWLSVLLLVAAFLIAILFTVSGVTRRTREFGTLKAIGWNNRRIVGQVAGESLVQGLIGGAVGVVLGVAGILIVNVVHPTLTAAASTGARGGQGGPGAAGGPGAVASAASSIALTLPITAAVLGIAVGLAILGGLLAGAFGGWRATRLRPAAALRSVA